MTEEEKKKRATADWKMINEHTENRVKGGSQLSRGNHPGPVLTSGAALGMIIKMLGGRGQGDSNIGPHKKKRKEAGY